MGLRNPLHTGIKYIVCAARPFAYPDGYPVNPKTIGEYIFVKNVWIKDSCNLTLLT